MARHGGGGSTQKHKAHKGGRKRQNKGGGERQGLKSQTTGRKGNKGDGAKRKRQQRAQDHRHKLRAKSLEEKRQATRGPPKIVATVTVCDDVDVSEVWNLLLDTARGTEKSEDRTIGGEVLGNRMDVSLASASSNNNNNNNTSEHAEPGCSSHLSNTFYVPDVKVRLTFLAPFDRSESANSSTAGGGKKGMLIRLLDYIRIADVVLFITKSSSAEVLDPVALSMCQVMRAFSLPNVYACVQGFQGLGLSEKAKMKKKTIKVFAEQVRESVTCFPLDTKQDCLHLFRTMKEHKQIVPIWRKQRPYLIADKVEITPQEKSSSSATGHQQQCSVSLVGYIRGQNLSVNQVVLLPGVGEYHMDRILQEKDPIAKSRLIVKHGAQQMEDMEEDSKTLAVASEPNQLESLVRENIPDPLAGEQTWPTEEEMREAEEMIAATKGRTVTKHVPKGFSEYQSAWIGSDDELDSDEMEFEDSTDDEEEENAFKASHGGGQKQQRDSALLGDGNELEIMPADDHDFDEDNPMNMDEQEDELDMDKYVENYNREKKSRKAAEDDDMEFPDEVDVPLDQPARERFVKYRGLKSFRTSPWDPKESLPREYAKIFAFENPVKAHKQAKARLKSLVGKTKEGLVVKGEYVKLVFSNVPEESAKILAQHFEANSKQSASPYVIFGLLQHETKMSLMNFSVHKSASFQEPLANKDELTFYTGIRTFKARPIISDSAPNVDKHKNQKFLRGGERCVFSVYAPIHHPPLPLLCFKEKESNEMVEEESSCQLVSSGLVDSVDPDRIVLKRIILTGFPHKVHKSKAYVRYMFHNPQDIKWFSPLELWTKYGRRGKIREPVGTHGTMKCMFDAVVQQRDTICLSLYKRVFPKWPENEDFNS